MLSFWTPPADGGEFFKAMSDIKTLFGFGTIKQNEN